MMYIALLIGFMLVTSTLVIASCMLSSQLSSSNPAHLEEPLRTAQASSNVTGVAHASSG